MVAALGGLFVDVTAISTTVHFGSGDVSRAYH
jgi:hypothetical protein